MAPIKIIDPFKHVSLLVSVAELRFAAVIAARKRQTRRRAILHFTVSCSFSYFVTVLRESLTRDQLRISNVRTAFSMYCTWNDSDEIAYYESIRVNRNVPRNLREIPPPATGEET